MVRVSETENKKLQTSIHNHELSLYERCDGETTEDCIICGEALKGVEEAYCCLSCNVFFHRSCIDDLPNEIESPLHPQHNLLLILPINVDTRYGCNCCDRVWMGNDHIVYGCTPCDFHLDVQCALVGLKTRSCIRIIKEKSSEWMHFAHQHPLTFKEVEERIEDDCFVCAEEMKSGPIYECFECKIYIHKSCVELPREIQSHIHPKHPLFLFASDPNYLICGGCGDGTKNFYYYCPKCELSFDVKCLLPSQDYEKAHQHTFSKISSVQNFICEACGEEDKLFPWVCNICHVFVHGRCAKLPQTIQTYGHNHSLYLSYYHVDGLDDETSLCEICRKENKGYAAYICYQCNYKTHLQCGKQQHDTHLLYKTKEEINEEVKVDQSILHQHRLTLTNELEDVDNKSCDGCLHLIFKAPFYSCVECDFFLHQQCTTLSSRIKTSILPGVFSLMVDQTSIFLCNICWNYNQGIHYQHETELCDQLDIRCASISNKPLTHLGHKHVLHSVSREQNGKEICGCCGEEVDDEFKFVCDECNNFLLHYKYATLPYRARHRLDQHALQLTYPLEDDSGEYYCDICENERDPECWFYHCKDCFFSAHPKCVLGKYPYLMSVKYQAHPHLLTYEQNMEKCQICKKGVWWMLECARCKFYICGEGKCFQTAMQTGELTFFHNRRG